MRGNRCLNPGVPPASFILSDASFHLQPALGILLFRVTRSLTSSLLLHSLKSSSPTVLKVVLYLLLFQFQHSSHHTWIIATISLGTTQHPLPRDSPRSASVKPVPGPGRP